MKFWDRSRIIAGQECPRLFWLHYALGGKGIQPAGDDIEALRGQAVHTVLGVINGGLGPVGAMQAMRAELEQAKATTWTREWIGDCAEGLGWIYYYGIWPALTRQYKFLAVEREERREIVPGNMFLARTDALMEHRVEGALTLLSIKTKKAWIERYAKEYTVDMQGLSEAWASEARGQGLGNPMPIQSVQMLYALVGPYRRVFDNEDDREAGINCAWLGWRKAGAQRGQTDYAVAWKYQDSVGKNRVLGNEWERFQVSKHFPGGIRQWVKMGLAGSQRDEFLGLFVKPPVIRRQPEALTGWVRQLKGIVWDWSNKLRRVEEMRPSVGLQEALDADFPQNLKNCYRYAPRRCGMFDICHGSAEWRPGELLTKAVSSGLYQVRVENHPEQELPLGFDPVGEVNIPDGRGKMQKVRLKVKGGKPMRAKR